MLAEHGPWTCHVRLNSLDALHESVSWLLGQGYKTNIDFEILDHPIEHRRTKKYIVAPPQPGKTTSSHSVIQQKIEPIILMNDASIASYVKLTWGI